MRLTTTLAALCLLWLSLPPSVRSQTLDPAFVPTVTYRDQLLPGTVRALARQADGRLLVAGDFLLFNNWPTNNVARLWPDGRVDTTFLAPVFSGGQIVAVAGDAQGRVVLGGSFQQVGGQPRRWVARLLPDGRLDSGFQGPALTTGSLATDVRAVAVQPDDKVFIGGSFLLPLAGGRVQPNVARLLANGQLDSSFVPDLPISGQVSAVALQADGKLLVAGNTYAQGTGLELARRLLPTGQLDPAFSIVPANQTIAGHAKAIAFTPNGFVLAGDFLAVGNQTMPSVARFGANGPLDLTFTSPFPNGVSVSTPLTSVAVEPGGAMYVGGDLISLGFQNYLARTLPNGQRDVSFLITGNGPNGLVRALSMGADGKLLIAGDFTTVLGQPRSGLAQLDAVILATVPAYAAARTIVWPVPAHDALHLHLDATAVPQRVQLLNNMGQIMLEQAVSAAETDLPIRYISPGHYILRVQYLRGIVTRKISVE